MLQTEGPALISIKALDSKGRVRGGVGQTKSGKTRYKRGRYPSSRRADPTSIQAQEKGNPLGWEINIRLYKKPQGDNSTK